MTIINESGLRALAPFRKLPGAKRPPRCLKGGVMMSDEELAQAVRSGAAELMPALWERVRGLIAYKARGVGPYLERCGLTVDDLVQEGYFSLLRALEHYDPEKGRFIPFLSSTLEQDQWGLVCRPAVQRRPLNSAVSLDAPMTGEDGGDGAALMDVVSAPCGALDEMEERIYREQLWAALERALDRIPEERAAAVREFYLEGRSLQEIADRHGVDRSRAARHKREGIAVLRHRAVALGLRQFIEERTDYYAGTGLSSFRRTGCSPVERMVLRRERMAERPVRRGRSTEGHPPGGHREPDRERGAGPA